MTPVDKHMAVYHSQEPQLLAEYEGYFAVISENRLVGIFTVYADAEEDMTARWAYDEAALMIEIKPSPPHPVTLPTFENMRAYREQEAKLVEGYYGKFALFHHKKQIAVFDTRADAQITLDLLFPDDTEGALIWVLGVHAKLINPPPLVNLSGPA